MDKYTPIAGDYFVVKTHGLAGMLIRIGTFSEWNHAGIYIGDGKIIEARPQGVTISDLSKYELLGINTKNLLPLLNKDKEL